MASQRQAHRGQCQSLAAIRGRGRSMKAERLITAQCAVIMAKHRERHRVGLIVLCCPVDSRPQHCLCQPTAAAGRVDKYPAQAAVTRLHLIELDEPHNIALMFEQVWRKLGMRQMIGNLCSGKRK